MKRVKNSDIKFKINKKLVYLPNFVIRFYTVNQKEYFFEKTQDDLVEYEREATVDDVEVILSGGTTVTEYYLPLNWSELLFVGQGILNYKLTNNIEDPEFPDYQYNKEEVVTTDFYIDSIKVDPEPDEGLIERVVHLEEHLAEEIVNREEADAAISGAVDSEIARAISAETALQEAIDAEETRATEAEAALNEALQAETNRATSAETALDTKIDQEIADRQTDVNAEEARAISAETALDAKIDAETNRATSAETVLQTAINDEATARANADTELQTAITNEVSRAREAESGITNSLNAEVTRATGAENALDAKIDQEIADRTADVDAEETRAKGVENALSGAIDTIDAKFIDDAKYEMSGQTHVINFYNGNTVKATIDCTDFLVDGMIDNVYIENGYLVIDFNTASGKQDIRIPLTDIFNPANYYTKSETSGATEIANALALKLNVSDFNTYSGAVDTLINSKASQSTVDALNGVVTAHTSDSTIHLTTGDVQSMITSATTPIYQTIEDNEEVTAEALNVLNAELANKLDVSAYTPTDLSNYYTKSETSGATEISTALSNKLDATAYTPTDLSNYYTKSETSGKTEISTALASKADSSDVYLKTETSGATELATAFAATQPKLSAGTGISIDANNVISATGGGSDINVVQTTGTSTADVMSQDAVTTQLNNKANKTAAFGGYGFGSSSDGDYIQYKNVDNSNIGNSIYYPKINGKSILTSNNIYARNNYNFELVETSAITTSVTSASTDSQIPSAKAVYDAIQEGGGSITVDSALDSGSTNPVENQALYSELRLSDGGEAETTLTFENRYTTNYPNGCTKIKVEVVGSMNYSSIDFYSDVISLGFVDVYNFDSISVDASNLQDATYEISGTTVIISYPTITNVEKFRVDNGDYVYKAVTTEAPTVLKDQVVANTASIAANTAALATKQTTLTAGTGIDITSNVISVTGGTGGGISSAECQTMIDQSISGKTNQSDFIGHTSNNSIHVTTAQTAAWNAKSDFSGSYNDLTDKPTIPTVPTSNTAFTNDAGYITANDITGKTDVTAFTAHTGDTTIHVTNADKTSWNGAVTALGGLKLVKLTQAQYDALATKDNNTLYVIVG